MTLNCMHKVGDQKVASWGKLDFTHHERSKTFFQITSQLIPWFPHTIMTFLFSRFHLKEKLSFFLQTSHEVFLSHLVSNPISIPTFSCFYLQFLLQTLSSRVILLMSTWFNIFPPSSTMSFQGIFTMKKYRVLQLGLQLGFPVITNTCNS